MKLKYAITTVVMAILAVATPCQAKSSVPDSAVIANHLSATQTTIPLPYNPELINSINKQQRKAVPHDLLQNANTIANIIEELGMPSELKFLPACLNTGDNTRCGDWSLTPIVAIKYGLEVTNRHDERFATEASTRAAMAYLTDLYKHYGDWWKSIMAFAYSPSAVNKLCSKAEISNPWDFESNIDNAHIVRNFITLFYLYNDKELTPKEEDYLEVDFKDPLNLNVLADKLKIDNSEIIELNPIFLGNVAYPLGGYQLRLPANKAEYFYEIYEELYKATDTTEQKANEPIATKPATTNAKSGSTSSAKPIKYKVKKGDTLGKIAQKNGTTVEKIKKLNNLKSDLINEGQLLTVKNAGESSKTPNTVTSVAQNHKGKTTHTIKKGETLSAIARQYQVKVSDIKNWNNMKSDMIQEGRKLVIYKK